jgi:DNA repair protein RecN (Recombination protein N)
MLKELVIKNYALIDELGIEYEPGLNILTGETGAGKSIIIGALSALLGERVDYDTIRTGAKNAEIEGAFTITTEAVKAVCQEAGIEPADDTLIIRRKLEKRGKTTNYVNDTLVGVSILKKVGDRLVDIHGQHEHQSLLSVDLHREVLDDFAKLRPVRDSLKALYHSYLDQTQVLKNLEEEIRRKKERQDLYQFQLKEIDEANLKSVELDELAGEKALLETAEKRSRLSQELKTLLSDEEGSVLSRLAESERRLEELAKIDPALKTYFELVKTVSLQADELWRALVAYQEKIEFSPERLEQINERLFLIDTLKKKYGRTIAEILALRDKIAEELSSIEIDESRITVIARDLTRLKQSLAEIALNLSSDRSRTKSILEKQVEAELATLGMPKARFFVGMKMAEDPEGLYESEGKRFRLNELGIDQIEFLFSANPGEEPKPLRKIASGGELSRIMLALKGVLTEADRIPVMVFDEVDVGIGGRIAEAVGKKLAALSTSRQVICITHLPQIAKYASRHFKVEKEVKGGRTYSKISKLDKKERVQELARMLGGEKITDTALRHARELLDEKHG